METLNAKIIGTKLGYDDHKIFSFSISLNVQGGGGVCLGGYAMDDYDKSVQKRIGSKWGMNVIMRILDVVGVDR